MAGEIIRPSALPDRPNPVASEKVPVDNGVTVGGATIEKLVLAGRPTASQPEAEAGTDPLKAMTPLTTKQAVTARIGVDIASKDQGDKADSAVQTIVGASGISVDATDPQNPIVSYTGTGVSDGDKGDVVVSGGGAVWQVKTRPVPTVAAAIADDPAVDPDFYDVAFFDTAQQPGSGATWKKVASNPGLAPGAAFQNANGTWYVNNASELRPEMFGRTGVNAAGDTAAWVAAASTINARGGGTIRSERQSYQINGSAVVFDAFDTLTLSLGLAEFHQQQTFSKTFSFTNAGKLVVKAGVGFGRGGAAGEYNGASVSYNGVAFIYCENVQDVEVDGAAGFYHAGGCIVILGGRKRTVRNCFVEGIGPDYIVAGNNGSDFGIMCQPTVNDATQLWLFEDTFENNRIFNTASCIQTVATRTLNLVANDLGPALGEHCVYGIENDGIYVVGNRMRKCSLFAYKNQLENYAGRFYGPAWAQNTNYAVGAVVRQFSVLWIAKTAHNSGASFVSANWNVHPLYYRNGGLIAQNNVDGCGAGLGSAAAAPTNGTNIKIDNLVIVDNTILNAGFRGLNLERTIGSVIKRNLIVNSGGVGIYAIDWSGECTDNTISGSVSNGLSMSINYSSLIEDNKLTNCGLSGSGDDARTPILLFPPNAANSMPDKESTPAIYFRGNGFFFPGGTAASTHLLYASDSRLNFRELSGTFGTQTSKTFRIDGSVERQFRNHFPGYFNTAQNVPAYTVTSPVVDRDFNPNSATVGEVGSVLGTLIADLQAARVVR